ncbi:MAG: thiamine pyrophosphate-dependent dehydrogenase E1 component subunit alpha [Desulfobacterales bacterium]
MVTPAPDDETVLPPRELLLTMYRHMFATRRFEEVCLDFYRQGLIRGYLHSYIGEEAVAAGACAALRPDDYIASTHRGHGHCIAKGADLRFMMAEILGRETGYCRGRGGSMHIASADLNHLGANGIVGGGIPLATGAALGIRVRGGDQVVISFFSDGASNNGVFAESLNLAGVFRLPVIYLLENNFYAVSTPIECATGCCELAGRGPAYGVPGICVDGNDAIDVWRETCRAVARARRGEGPTLIEARTFRWGGHHANDPGHYIDPGRLAAWKERDPLAILRRRIDEPGAVAAVESGVEAELAAAIDFALNSPEPDLASFLAAIEP